MTSPDSLRLQRDVQHYACLRHNDAACIEGVDDTEMYNIVTVCMTMVCMTNYMHDDGMQCMTNYIHNDGMHDKCIHENGMHNDGMHGDYVVMVCTATV